MLLCVGKITLVYPHSNDPSVCVGKIPIITLVYPHSDDPVAKSLLCRVLLLLPVYLVLLCKVIPNPTSHLC